MCRRNVQRPIYRSTVVKSLQYRILVRGVELLEVGGRLIYSTCSFNPIENEAVVAAILHKSQGSIELLDTSEMLPGLQRMPGLSSWKVIANGKEIQTLDEVPENEKRYRTTMWPPKDAAKLNLHRCIRMLPHHEDSGGFFVAVLQKTCHLPWSKQGKVKQDSKQESTSSQQTEDVNPKQSSELTTLNYKDKQESIETEEQPKSKKMKYMNVYKEDPFVFFKDDVDIWPQIKSFYGVADEFPLNQMFTRCHVGKKRNVYMVNSAVRQIVKMCEDKLKVINCGVKLWARSDAKGVDCDFRLAQDGIYSLYPYLTSRKVEITREDVRVILTEENPFSAKLCKETKNSVEALSQGSVIFVYDPKKYDQESEDLLLYIVGWRGKTSVRSFVPKGDRYHILRLCDMLPQDKMFSNDDSGKSTVQNPKHVTEEALLTEDGSEDIKGSSGNYEESVEVKGDRATGC